MDMLASVVCIRAEWAAFYLPSTCKQTDHDDVDDDDDVRGFHQTIFKFLLLLCDQDLAAY